MFPVLLKIDDYSPFANQKCFIIIYFKMRTKYIKRKVLRKKVKKNTRVLRRKRLRVNSNEIVVNVDNDADEGANEGANEGDDLSNNAAGDDDDDDDDDASANDDDDNDLDFVEDASCFSSSSSVDSEVEMHRLIVEQLKHEFLEEHLSVELVKRTAATVNTMINRYAKFFVWLRKKFQDSDSNINVLKMLQDIVLDRFQILIKYYKYLTEIVLLKPSTVYNFNEEVGVLLNWFAVFRASRKDTFAVKPSDLYSVNLVIKAMRKFYSKERILLSCKSTDNTVEGLIAARKWPQGGLKELHDAVLSQMPWARATCADPASLRDPTVYNHFMDLMCASFYTGTSYKLLTLFFINLRLLRAGSPQGRVGAFNKAEYAMADEILRKHYVSSTNFKTALQYGHQCLTTSAVSLELFHLFFEVVRPLVMQGARDPLFISSTGTLVRFGRHLTAFFKRVTGLHITSTTIRSIVTTESASLRGNNLITAEEQDGVHHHSGHCGVTAKKFYQKQERLRDMANATTVHNKLLTTLPPADVDSNSSESELDADPDSDASDVSSITDTSDGVRFPFFAAETDGMRSPVNRPSIAAETDGVRSPATSVFPRLSVDSSVGRLHPSIAGSGRTIPWTETEINIVGTWCKRYRSQHPGNSNVVAGCLRYILNDNDIRQHFHPHHVMDSARLRWGWQKYQEQES